MRGLCDLSEYKTVSADPSPKPGRLEQGSMKTVVKWSLDFIIQSTGLRSGKNQGRTLLILDLDGGLGRIGCRPCILRR